MYPETEAELADLLSAATAPLCIQGGGTRGCAIAGDILSMRSMAGVELYEPGALTLTAKAGTPLKEVETLLATEGQRLAFEPMDHRLLLGTTGEPTLGGICAANVSGPRRIQSGAARDFLLGVRFVDGTGQIIKNGGRVMKNVTGYDLVKLMAGAHGTLGVLTELSLKVLPMAEAEATVCLANITLPQAVSALSAALGAPYDVSGAAYNPAAACAYIRVEGFADSVAYRAEQLAARLAGFGTVRVEEDTQALWSTIRDVTPLAGMEGDIWRISVKPSDAVALTTDLNAKALLLDWGGGLVWACMPEGSDLRARMQVPGHATLMRASVETRQHIPRFHPDPAPLAALSAGLRAKFDPRGILNTGLMG